MCASAYSNVIKTPSCVQFLCTHKQQTLYYVIIIIIYKHALRKRI